MKCNMNHRDSYKPEHMPEREEEYKYYPHPKPRPKHQTETILKCGTSVGSGPLSCNSGLSVDGGYGSPHTVEATVALDTSELINPTVKIDFSSLISFKTIGDDNYFLRLVFKLSKVCGGSPIPLGTWAFEQIHQERDGKAAQVDGCEFVQETDAFSFSWCECDDCPDCCRYIVEIVDQQCYNIDFVTVSNISLTALAVGKKKIY